MPLELEVGRVRPYLSSALLVESVIEPFPLGDTGIGTIVLFKFQRSDACTDFEVPNSAIRRTGFFTGFLVGSAAICVSL